MPEKAAKQKYPHVDEMWIRVQGWDPDQDPVLKSLAPSPDPFFSEKFGSGIGLSTWIWSWAPKSESSDPNEIHFFPLFILAGSGFELIRVKSTRIRNSGMGR